MVQEIPGASGLGWNIWRPVNLGPAYLEVENLVLGYPYSVCLETARVWYPRTVLGRPEVSHRVCEFRQECLAGCSCPTHLLSHRQWLAAKRRATNDLHVPLELHHLTRDGARRLRALEKDYLPWSGPKSSQLLILLTDRWSWPI